MNPTQVLRQACTFDAPHLLTEQLALIDRGYTTAVVLSGLVACVTAVAYQVCVGDPNIWAWTLCALLIGAGSLVWRARAPGPREAKFQPLPHARWLCLTVGLNGGVWGLGALCFIQPGVPDATNLFICMIGGLSSAGLALFGPSWPVGLSYWFGCVGPLALALLRLNDAVSLAVGLAALVYFGAMVSYSYHAARMARDSIALRFQNAELVGRLREQTDRAVEARHQAEQALLDAEEADRAKTVFLASASHDLRQPLHAVGLYLGALARAGLNDRQGRLVRQVVAANDAATEMLNTLLDFSKLDAGVVKPQQRPFALQPLLHRLHTELAPLAESKGLVFRLRDTRQVVQADPALVDMVLRNLLVNAIRYTERGGVLLGVRLRGAQATIEVWDTGIGIPAHQHRQIFREFHQLGNPERDRRKGLGLGLAIVDGLVRAMNVHLDLDSQVGRGSVFRLYLPQSQATLVNPMRPAQQGCLAGLKVLLIEDDVCVREAMSDLLHGWGCHCAQAADLDEALIHLPRFAPHIVLADHRLRHHRTGIEAIAAVRQRLGRAVPALVVTGDTASEPLREAHASGLTLLHKPVPAERLHAELLSLWRLVQADRDQGAPVPAAG